MFAISKKYVRGTKVKVIHDLQWPFYNKLNFDHFPIIYERLFECLQIDLFDLLKENNPKPFVYILL